MIYGGIAILAAFGMFLYFMRRDNRKRGESEAKQEIMEHENEAIANRPITDDDLLLKLREKSLNARKLLRKP